MKTCYLDIETDLAHQQIWCAVTKVEGQDAVLHTSSATLPSPTEYVYVAHYGMGFDFPMLSKVWNWHVPVTHQEDTILLSKLWDTNIKGGASLRAWGERLKLDDGKIDFDKELFDWGYTEEMGAYCVRDVEVLEKVHKYLTARVGTWTDAISLEHKVRDITNWQQECGFKMDVSRVTEMWTELVGKRASIEQQLHEVFPPIVTKRISEKTGKRLKDDVEVFNIGSRQQIARRLESLGAKFTERTEPTENGGGGNIKVDESTLKPLATKYPEAQLCLDYLTLGKREGMLNGWLKNVNDDGRMYGSVDTLGAITGRMTHQRPNMAQVEKGEAMRGCWIVDEGNRLVGVDASGLELRMLAHYMQDPDYTHQVSSGDVHTVNQLAAGLETRDEAKTFIYAFLYGAGDEKIGSIIGKGASAGKAMKARFLKNTPALKDLREKISRIAEQGSIPALDGRRLRVRHKHAALNTLLQGAGAIVMKRGLVVAHGSLAKADVPWRLVAQVHDEIQAETWSKDAHVVGQHLVHGIVEAGRYYNMRCPLAAEAKIGNSWAETH